MYRRSLTLNAGDGFVSIPIYGKYFRLLAGTGNIDCRVVYPDGSTVEFNALTGVGLDLRSEATGDGFRAIEFKSTVTQTIDILATVFPSTDTRLVGDVNLNGTMTVINQVAGTRQVAQGVAYAATTATQILPIDSSRLKTMLVFTTDVYLGIDNTVTSANGFLLTAGTSWIDENQGALWVYAASAGTARYVQDRK